MRKTEWIEQHEKDLERYGKSILSHDDDWSYVGSDDWYDKPITHHDDWSYYGTDDWYEPMGHFRD